METLLEQRFSADSGYLNYVEGGIGSRPVVTLHGMTLDWQSMAGTNAALDASAHWYALDLPGHGKSAWCESGYRISEYAAGVAAFVERVSGRGSVLVGNCLGAMTAFEVAARLPALVAGVVAVEPPLILISRDFEAISYSDAYHILRCVNEMNSGRMTFAQAVARYLELQPGLDEAGAGAAMSVAAAVDPRVTQGTVAGSLFEDLDFPQTLRRVACPILLIRGETQLGSLIRDQDVEFVAANASMARAIQVSGRGHGILSDDPADWVNGEILRFLESTDLT